MTTPRVVTGDDWQARHDPIIAAWAQRHLNEVNSRVSRQFTPEFLRAYNFVTGQEDTKYKVLHYDQNTWNDLARHAGIPGGNSDQQIYIARALAHNPSLEQQTDKSIAYQLWRQSNAQHMPAALGLVHYDALVNHGSTGARNLLLESEGDPNKYIDARDSFYASIPETNREGGPIKNPGWRNRRIPALRRAVRELTQTQGTQ